MFVKRSVNIAVIATVAILTIVGVVGAQKFTYTSGVNVQNLSADPGELLVTYYNAGVADGSGGTQNMVTDPIAIDGFGVKNFFPIHAPAGFSGSVVISSSKPVAAVTNITNTSLTVLGAYNGRAAGSPNVYLPLLHKANSGFDSWYSIQNTGSVAATVQIDYSSTGIGVDSTVIVAPNASVNVYQKDETIHGTFKTFAASLTSTQPIVVVVLQESTSNILAYTGFSSGSKLPVMPTINQNNAQYITGTQVYNLGAESTDVTISYTAGQYGTDCTETRTVPAKTMVIFTTDVFMKDTPGISETCVNGQRFLGSAKVTTNSTNQDLAVLVNQLKIPGVNGSAYSAFDPATATNSVFMPTIFDRNAGWYTAFNVINVGTGTTYVKCTFAGVATTQDTGVDGLGEGKSVTITQYGVLQDRYVGSAVCRTYTDNTYTTEDTTDKILTVVNELGTGSPDNLLTYEGINP
ncbi:MAG: hypothetical protein JW987_06040 [Anaerolineaceae bacterium]|nr:hypothetical protein [Anaerolineaceae bacterium]